MKKLGLLVMPLMAVSLLASCNKGGGDKPIPEEYTLTITLDNCKIGEESTTYTKKYIEGTTIDAINVTPTDNNHVLTENSVPSEYKNYWKESSTVGTWTFSNLVMNDNHEFKISATELVTLTITLDNCKIGEETTTYTKTYVKGAIIDAINVTPSDDHILTESSVPSDYKQYWKESSTLGTWTFSNLTMDKNHEFTISADESATLTITLNNCKIGEETTTYTKTYVKGATIDAINVTPSDDHILTESSVPSDYKQYWKESSTLGTWTFSNLTMDKNHEFTISATESATLTITLNDCKIGEETSTYTKTYVKGATIDAINVTPTESCFLNENSISIDYKDYWSEGADGSWILSNLVMNDNYTINIKGLHNYHASVDEAKCEHLSFTTIDDKPLDNVLTTEGEDFTFKMKATVESNGEGYKLPTYLFIYVGDSTVELESDCYIIDPITPQYEATVTILGENVTDDIKISGKGVPEDYYAVDASKCFGVGAQIETQYSPYLYTNLDGVVTFTQEGTYELPTKENIIVKFDDNDWINPSDDSEWCTYDENSHKLTLKADKAVSNVVIAARSPKYQILKELSWKKISDYSTAKYAPYLFYIGDTKKVEVNGLNHEVRIIGFNHDELSTSTKEDPQYAGITFEFVNLLSDNNGYSLATVWNWESGSSSRNYDYPNSNLRKALDGEGNGSLAWYQKGSTTKSSYGTALSMLPADLQSEIKKVKKPIATTSSYGITSYDTKLFTLSYREMTTASSSFAKEEGTTYTYYKNHDDNASRIHKQVKGTEVYSDHSVITDGKYNNTWNYAGYNYKSDSTGGGYSWLRSPGTYDSSGAWYCGDDGNLYGHGVVYNSAYAVAPAFCI